LHTLNLYLRQVKPQIITKIERSAPQTPRVRKPDFSLVVQQGVKFQREPRVLEGWTLATIITKSAFW